MASTFNSAAFSTVFSTLTTAIKTELNLQWDEKRILGNEYANVYAQLMDTALKLSYGDQIQQAQINKIDADIINGNAMTSNDTNLKTQQILSMKADDANKTVLSTNDTNLKTQQIASMANDDMFKGAMNIADIALKEAQTASLLKETDLKQADVNLKNAQSLATSEQSAADSALKGAQKLVYDRQRKGFNDNIKQKLFEAQLNAWGLMFSSGMLEAAPSFTGTTALNNLYDSMITDIVAEGATAPVAATPNP